MSITKHKRLRFVSVAVGLVLLLCVVGYLVTLGCATGAVHKKQSGVEPNLPGSPSEVSEEQPTDSAEACSGGTVEREAEPTLPTVPDEAAKDKDVNTPDVVRSLTIIVESSSDVPIANALCEMEGSQARTDGNGFANLVLGDTPRSAKMIVSALGYETLQLLVQPSATELKVRLVPLSGVGMVLDGAGIAVEGAAVHVCSLSSDLDDLMPGGAERHVATTDASGAFQFAVRPFTQYVDASFAGNDQSLTGFATIGPGADTVTVRLSPAATIRVMTHLNTEATALLHDANGSTSEHAAPFIDGVAVLSGLKPYSTFSLRISTYVGFELLVSVPGPGETATIPIFPPEQDVELTVSAVEGHLPEFASPAFFVPLDNRFVSVGRKLSRDRISLPSHLFPLSHRSWIGLLDVNGDMVAISTADRVVMTSEFSGSLTVTTLSVRKGVVMMPNGHAAEECQIAFKSQRPCARPFVTTRCAEDGVFHVSLVTGVPYAATAYASDIEGEGYEARIEDIPSEGEIRIQLQPLKVMSFRIDDGGQDRRYTVSLSSSVGRWDTFATRSNKEFELHVGKHCDGIWVTCEHFEQWIPIADVGTDGVLHVGPSNPNLVRVRVLAGASSEPPYRTCPGVVVKAWEMSLAKAKRLGVTWISARAVTNTEGDAILTHCPGGKLTFSVGLLDGTVLVSASPQTTAGAGEATVTIAAPTIGLIEAWGTCSGIGSEGGGSLSMIQSKSHVADGQTAREMRDSGVEFRFVTQLERYPGAIRGTFHKEYTYLYACSNAAGVYEYVGRLRLVADTWRADIAR